MPKTKQIRTKDGGKRIEAVDTTIKAIRTRIAYFGTCLDCGGQAELEWRLTADGIMRDQPKCCRGSKKVDGDQR